MNDKIDHERMNYVCNKILENDKILQGNKKLWTVFLDRQLYEFVILYNFDFYEVANRFHDFIQMHKKYDFTEAEIRRHWSFLHAARYLGLNIDDKYYSKLRESFKAEEEERKKKEEEREQMRIKQEEDDKKTQKDIEKYKYERFNLITINPEENNKNDLNEIGGDGKNIDFDMKKDEAVNAGKENCEEEINTNLNSNSNKDNDNDKDNDEKIKDTDDQNNQNDLNDNQYDDEVINDLFRNGKNKIRDLREYEREMNKYKDIDKKEEDEKLEYDENLFPIKTNTEINHINDINHNDIDNFHNEFNNKLNQINSQGIDSDIEKTKNFDDFIQEDPKLKEQYDNLNTYYNFAVKSLNYHMPKLGQGLKPGEEIPHNIVGDEFETEVIKKTSSKINDLFFNSMKEASEKLHNMTDDEISKRIAEDDAGTENGTENKVFKRNIEEPSDEDQEKKLGMFKQHLFSNAKAITTPELLSQIVGIINNTYIDEVKIRNDAEDENVNSNVNVNVDVNGGNMMNTMSTMISESSNNENSNSEYQLQTTGEHKGKYKYGYFILKHIKAY